MHHESSRLFGLVQILVLAVVIATAILYRRRQKLLEKDSGARLVPDVRAYIQRTPVRPPSPGSPPRRESPPRLEPAFPEWTKNTPPYEILGLKPGASATDIEAAYKTLLKKYHPDRFASWGRGYQNRAHQIVLLVQDARSRLLSGR